MVSEDPIYRRSIANRGPYLHSVDPPECTLFEAETDHGESLDPAGQTLDDDTDLYDTNKARSISQVETDGGESLVPAGQGGPVADDLDDPTD
jgi:hypothetical protein